MVQYRAKLFCFQLEGLFSNMIDSFLASVPTLYAPKIPESQRFSRVFRGDKMGTLARNGLTTSNHLERDI